MKKILLYISLIFISYNAQAATTAVATEGINNIAEVQSLPTELQKLNVADFLNITPEKYSEMTGKKLGIVNTLKLKAAQKVVKNHLGGDMPIEKGVYVLLAILGLAWIAMGLADDWKGNDWVVNLILTILCWLPGLIHALVKMKKYY
jgi:uncharacterized membrane protein YqaE (UPF0057 family)